MNKLYIIVVLLMGFTSIQGQITQMTVHETGGNTVTFQIANVDSITYDTTTIAICGANSQIPVTERFMPRYQLEISAGWQKILDTMHLGHG